MMILLAFDTNLFFSWVNPCAYMRDHGWWFDAFTCDTNLDALCQPKRHNLTGHHTFNRSYTMEQLTFPFINVRYHYRIINQTLLDSWQQNTTEQNKSTTGFKFKWFILPEDSFDKTTNINFYQNATSTQPLPSTKTSGTGVRKTTGLLYDVDTTTLSSNPSTSEKTSDGKRSEGWLGRMVEVARLARLANMTRQQVLLKIIQLKMLNSSFVQFFDECEGGQLDKTKQTEVFNDINSILNKENTSYANYEEDNEDIETGVMIYYTIAQLKTNKKTKKITNL